MGWEWISAQWESEESLENKHTKDSLSMKIIDGISYMIYLNPNIKTQILSLQILEYLNSNIDLKLNIL